MKTLVPLRRILQGAEERGLDLDSVVCDPETVHIVQTDNVPEPDLEE